MLADFDYGVQYGEFHQDTDAHFENRVAIEVARLQPLLPSTAVNAALDIGCGRGYSMTAMQRLKISDIEGIDIDRSQIEYARSRGLRAHLTSDISEFLNERDKKVDFITMMDVLEHVPKSLQVETIRSIYRSLSPGGRLVIQVPNANSILASRWLYNDFTHVCSYTEQSLRPLLINGGFRKIRISSAGDMGQRPSFRPNRIFTRVELNQLRRWLVRLLWRQVLIAELGDMAGSIPMELNLLAIADKPLLE